MKTSDIIFTIILVLFFLGFLALGIFYYISTRPNNNAVIPDKNSNVSVWGQPEKSSDPNKSVCQVYNFPTTVAEIGGVKTFIPGTPTYDSATLDKLTGSTQLPKCTDPDQIIASQEIVTCKSPPQAQDPSIARCIRKNNTIANPGETDIFYGNNFCPAVPKCTGTLGVVSLNYQSPIIPKINCLTVEANGNLNMSECDITNDDQLFRISRTNPGQKPTSGTNGQSTSQTQSGILIQFLHRKTGLCVFPDFSAPQGSSYFDPSSVPVTGPGCVRSEYLGFPLKLNNCAFAGFYDGYSWMALPSLNYCSKVEGCKKEETTLTPPQMVYIGDHVDTFPIDGKYQGLTGSNAIVKWCIDNKLSSMYFGGGTDLIAATNAFGSDMSVQGNCWQFASTSQYLNISGFNSILQQSVCYANNSQQTSNCINL